jgi:two-component system NtrC family response regulator
MNPLETDRDQPPKRSILIIDDEPTIGKSCQRVLEREDYKVFYHQNGKSGLKDALNGEFDLILLDLLLPEIDGMEILRTLKSKGIPSEVIVITGYATVQTAVEAMQLGAMDYISKPFSPDELIINVRRIFQHMELKHENIALKEKLKLHEGFQGIIGESASMKQVFKLIRRVAGTESNILITGESGTGKEVIAQAIHKSGLRRDQPFIACDCGALTPTLLESELFGHVKGSYSGAISTKQGLFEIANKGTLFLDEVSNISLEIQSKLLRVLETRKLRRVGDTEERSINIRLIAASNQDLAKMVEDGSFRNDLYYRLEVIPIHLPPLRERKEDIVRLATSFLEHVRNTGDIQARQFSQEAMQALEKYPWPGNIRELKNLVERVAILCDAETIEAKHLPKEIMNEYKVPEMEDFPATWEEFKSYKQQVREEVVRRIEKEFLITALTNAGGNISQAAKEIGMQRTNFHSLLKKYHIDARNYKS